MSIAFCKNCKDIIISPRGGLFVECPCGESFIDQERFDGMWARLGGEAELIERICPPTCKQKAHRQKLSTG